MANWSLRKKIIIGLIILLFILIIIVSFLSRKTNPPPVPTTGLPTPATYSKFQVQSPIESIQKINLPPIFIDPQIEIPLLPPTLPVYSATIKTIDINSAISELIKYFKLNTLPITSQTWSDSSKSQFLNIDPKNILINYHIDSLTQPSAYIGTYTPDNRNAILTSRNFISSIPQLSSFSINTDEISYFLMKKNSQEFFPANQSEANLIQIPFSQTVNDIPIYNPSSVSSYVNVTIGQNNQIVRFSIGTKIFDYNQNSSQFYPSVSKDVLNSRIDSGKLNLIEMPLADITDKISAIYISNVSLKYLYSTESNLLVPQYFLEGYFLSPTDNNKITVILVSPAVNQ